MGVALLVIFMMTSCAKEEEDIIIIHEKLSDYNFFVGNINQLIPGERVLPYDLITPLFSDYALKPRFLYMPKGKAAVYEENGTFKFPTGAVLIKNFLYLDDFRDANSKKRILETRLMIKRETDWETATYIWSDNQAEAQLSVVGKIVPVSWTDESGTNRSTQYIIPNKNDCKGCHALDSELVLLGPRARNLNRDYNFEEGTMNQLDKWTQLGYLTGAPASGTVPAVPDWSDPNSGSLNDRARAYLDVNCAHCHNPRGPANNSALNLEYDVTDPRALGICKMPVAAGGGSGGLKFGIVPGKPEESIMVFRMSSTMLDEAMPELGKTLVHDEGLHLITEWIHAMEGDCN